MSYPKSETTFNRAKIYLDKMAESTTDLKWLPNNGVTPEKFAWQLRGAINYARSNSITPYDTLLDKYTLRVRHPFVIAEIKSILGATLIEDDIVGTFSEISDALSAISVLVKNKDTRKLRFPNIDLESNDGEVLASWCKANNCAIYDNDGLMIERS